MLIARHAASSHVIPSTHGADPHSSANNASAPPAYSPHVRCAMSAIRGANLSFVGPGISARNNCIPPAPASGKIATIKNSTPIPPKNCVSDRHSRIAFGCASSPASTVTPVVVIPEYASNTASVHPAVPESQYGSDATSPAASHPDATAASPSRRVSGGSSVRRRRAARTSPASTAPSASAPAAVAQNARATAPAPPEPRRRRANRQQQRQQPHQPRLHLQDVPPVHRPRPT